MAEARIEQEAERTTAIRVGTGTAAGVTIWLDEGTEVNPAEVTITAPRTGGQRLHLLADTPELREAFRAVVKLWDMADEAAERQVYWDAVQAARA